MGTTHGAGVPQVDPPKEKEILKVDNNQFRVPGSKCEPEKKITKVNGTTGFNSAPQLCVTDIDED